jgi:hypothetical protein
MQSWRLVGRVAELWSLDVKALLAASCAIVLASSTCKAALADPPCLDLLTNYYHDCPAREGPRAAQLRSVIRRALRGDTAAMRLLITHGDIFSTVDNEGYTEVPQALLRTLGDDRYVAFVIRQPRHVQEQALNVYPKQIPEFERRFPKTAKL